MRKSYRNIKRTSFLILAFISSLALGAEAAKTPRAVVARVQGNVFVTSNQQTKKLDAGSFIYDFDDIFTEVGAELVFRDYFDHEYHVSGSSYISMLNKIVELKSGYVWVKSIEETDDKFQLQTVNATISYNSGEYIASYDPENGKTQILSITGTHTINNNVYEFMKEQVGPGRFSFVKEDYENGAPRVPTPISSSAYEAVTSLFPAVKPMNERTLVARAPRHKDNKISQELYNKTPKRSTASVTLREDMRVSNRPGEIVVRQSHTVKTRRDIASVGVEGGARATRLEQFYEEKLKEMAKEAPKKKKVVKKFKPDYTTKSDVEVNVYGPKSRVPASKEEGPVQMQKEREYEREAPQEGVRPERKFRPEKPQSLRNPASVPSPVDEELKNDVFESSLRREYLNQQKHSDAVNSLINDLESYSQDYKEAY
ncbi:hypothetical protein ACRXCV_07330 [Halobacteriovorax sp. GFR7]|uniref:hypothetical protein n=1 Tax=unclassified Halobacteriovorax TaxID=2639665 RepID=UPI003D97E973